MFGSKQRRIDGLEEVLSKLSLQKDMAVSMKDHYAERNLVLEKELRITNKACRNKKKLSKALHEANKKIKELEDKLHNALTIYEFSRHLPAVSFIDDKPPAPAEHATTLPNCT